MNCKNCKLEIDDARKAPKCDACSSPLHNECSIKDGGTYCDVCYMNGAQDAPREDDDIIIPESIRRTYIETYRACPHKFFLEVLKGNESPPTCYTQIGIDLHELFEDASQGVLNDAESMHRLFDATWDSYEASLFKDNEQKQQMRKRATDSIDTFWSVLPTLPPTPFATEQTIRFSIGDDIPDVEFTMDRIDEVDEELEMLDWKTGGVMVGKKLEADFQAPLYIYGVQKHYERPVRKFTFYYLKDNKTRVFVRSETNPDIFHCYVGKRKYTISLLDTIREIQSLFGRMKNKDFNIPTDTKPMYFTCKMCHLREKGLCSGAEQESWYQTYNKGGLSWT